MALINNRVILSDDGTLIDLSVNLSKFVSGTATVPIVAAEDKLYIASDLPFNHRWIEVSTVNDQTATISDVEVWDGDSWNSVVEIIDQTSVGGVTLAQSGIVSWTTDQDESWLKDHTNDDGDVITGLSTVTIYGLYWARITVDADLNAATALQYVGHKFSADADVGVEYPALNLASTKDAFETGKTNWDDQHFKAAEDIIRDLRQQGIAWNKNQLLAWDEFTDASVHKVAELVYRAFGDDTADNRAAARNDYKAALNKKNFNIDQDRNARASESEKRFRTGWLTR